MRLRRGMVRESCDFCHRRKIKCDRLIRGNLGHKSCSQCSLRQIHCCIDDSDDIRLRRRQQDSVQVAPVPIIHGPNPNNESRSLDTTHTIAATTPSISFASSLLPPSPEAASVLSVPSCLTTDYDFSLLDDPFQLSPDSIFFLDSIFMGEHDSSWTHQISETQGSPAHTDGGFDPPPWRRCHMDEAVFFDALHAYFTFAALYLPVLVEDTFWNNYNAGRCSLSLIYAVVCRGLAFVATDGKLDIQQRVACRFQDEFLQAQLKATGSEEVCLDDLEALTLMVHFQYDRKCSRSSQVQNHLASLFLTHESLVLMTIRLSTSETPRSETTIGGQSLNGVLETDRRTLLYWHVYGLDAFRCLDKKIASRIPESDASVLTKQLPKNNSRGYLDAILDLSIIARESLNLLCNITARHTGVKIDNVTSLYRRLEQWRLIDCPPHLQRQRDSSGRLKLSIGLAHFTSSPLPLSSPPSLHGHIQSLEHVQLHRAVIWLLEINCYMQIEDCVSRYGIQDSVDSLSSEMLALRVESESVGSVRDAVEVARSLLEYQAREKEQGKSCSDLPFSLADLAPSIIRDCCSGACIWACNRGKMILDMQRHDAPNLPWLRSASRTHSGSEVGGGMRENERKQTYLTAATTLRNAAASATSHSDTQPILTILDQKIALLQEFTTL